MFPLLRREECRLNENSFTGRPLVTVLLASAWLSDRIVVIQAELLLNCVGAHGF